MNLLVKMQFGSHVYGTNVPTSDQDFKGIYLPSSNDILLQKVKNTIVRGTKSDPNAKNTQDDIDLEIFSLQQYLHLLMEGQTVAMDMIFTPEKFYLPLADGDHSHPAWRDIKENKLQFLHSGVSAFAGYCRQQASKYGIKGSRVNAVRQTLEFFAKYPKKAKLKDYEAEVRAFVSTSANLLDTMMNKDVLIQIVPILHKGRGIYEDHIEVCGKKFGFHTTFEYVVERLQLRLDGYGQRALLAETNQGVDWKALMHAVRVCKEAQELLLTGNITFPRPESELLLKIRKGELPYKEVAEIIEQGLIDMEEANGKSILPAQPNRQLAADLVESYYGDVVRGHEPV